MSFNALSTTERGKPLVVTEFQAAGGILVWLEAGAKDNDISRAQTSLARALIQYQENLR